MSLCQVDIPNVVHTKMRKLIIDGFWKNNQDFINDAIKEKVEKETGQAIKN